MRRLAFVALSALSLSFAPARAQVVDISDNVLFVPDPGAKATTFTLIVHAGCVDEANGKCLGLSHYLEHLIFLGRNADLKDKAIAFFKDGAGNGSTSYFSTSYFQRFPARPQGQAEDLEKLFRFYTERLQDFDAREDEAERERGIVLQEYNWRIASSPQAQFFVKFNRAMLPDDPLGQSVAGSPEIIANYSVAAARAFHKRWYARNNATIVIHGPVDAALVKSLADKYVAPLPAKELPDRAWLQALRSYEPSKQVLLEQNKDIKTLDVVSDKMVRIEESDRVRAAQARGVLMTFLRGRFDGGPHDRLVEKAGLTSGIDHVDISRVGPGALRVSFSAEPGAGVAPEKMIDAFWSYMDELARTGVPKGIVERLKKRIAEDREIDAREPERVAAGLTRFLFSGTSYADYKARAASLATVTDEDVNAIIRAAAGPGRRVDGILSPAP